MKTVQCAHCRARHTNPRSVLCPKCTKIYESGKRVACDGFVLQKKKKKVRP